MSVNIVLMGAPGAGKGTQAKKIVKEFGIPQISTGDILREKKNEASGLGKQIQEIMASGGLVSDEIVIQIIRERLQNSDCANGFILDGFPRTVGQADALDQMLEQMKAPLTAAILIDVPLDCLLERLTGRRVCAACKHEFHIRFNPPKVEGVCDYCGSALEQRSDDREETIRKRRQEFEDNTTAAIEYYARKKKLVRIDGLREIEVVYADIRTVLQG